MRLNLCLDFCKGDGPEVVVVNAYIVLEREEHPETRMVQTGVAPGPAVNVPEELPDIPVRASVAEEGVVVQNDSLTAHADGHLLGDVLEAPHVALTEAFHVVVAQYKVFAAGEGAEDVVPEARTAVSEVPKVKDSAVFGYGCPPAADELGIHLLCVPKRPVAEADDVFMAEVGVGGEPDATGLEFIDLFWHGVFFWTKVRPLFTPCKSLQGLQEFGNQEDFAIGDTSRIL